MSTERNKHLVRYTFEKLFNTGELALADELVSQDFLNHDAPPGVPPGPAGLRQMVTMLRTAFPDIQFTVEDLVAEGDTVGHRFTARGTHQGELLGIAPTGRPVLFTGMIITRFAGDQVVEDWDNIDMLGLLHQLGVIPALGQGSR